MSSNSKKDKIRQIFENLPEHFKKAKKEECRERGKHGSSTCLIRLNETDNILILDGDKVKGNENENEKSCDCLIFIDKEELYFCFVELKNKSIEPSLIIQKFENSIDRIQKECGFLVKMRFEPKFILVFQKITSQETDRLLKQRFRLFGKSSELIRTKCGSQLMDIL